jgi:hypothetical protein
MEKIEQSLMMISAKLNTELKKELEKIYWLWFHKWYNEGWGARCDIEYKNN